MCICVRVFPLRVPCQQKTLIVFPSGYFDLRMMMIHLSVVGLDIQNTDFRHQLFRLKLCRIILFVFGCSLEFVIKVRIDVSWIFVRVWARPHVVSFGQAEVTPRWYIVFMFFRFSTEHFLSIHMSASASFSTGLAMALCGHVSPNAMIVDSVFFSRFVGISLISCELGRAGLPT